MWLVTCDTWQVIFVYYWSCVCAIAENPIPGGLETSGQRAYRIYWHVLRYFCVFVFLMFFCVLNFFWFLWSLQTSLVCLLGELAGRGSVAMSVSVSDKWKVTGDMWHATQELFSSFILSFLPVLFCLFRYWCYCLHTLRDSVSTVCVFFVIYIFASYMAHFPS